MNEYDNPKAINYLNCWRRGKSMFGYHESDLAKAVESVAGELKNADKILRRFMDRNQNVPFDRAEDVHAILEHAIRVLEAVKRVSDSIRDLIEQESAQIRRFSEEKREEY